MGLFEAKEIIANQMLLPKLWYISKIQTIPKYVQKEIERIYNFWLNLKKKMDLKVIKYHQCSVEKSYALIELNSKFL